MELCFSDDFPFQFLGWILGEPACEISRVWSINFFGSSEIPKVLTYFCRWPFWVFGLRNGCVLKHVSKQPPFLMASKTLMFFCLAMYISPASGSELMDVGSIWIDVEDVECGFLVPFIKKTCWMLPPESRWLSEFWHVGGDSRNLFTTNLGWPTGSLVSVICPK